MVNLKYDIAIFIMSLKALNKITTLFNKSTTIQHYFN